ncbi:MAG: alpha-E domain-containing protein [Parasutterella excrementihominis]
MDFISIEKGENLFWLGRYVERVYRTLNYLEGLYDVLIDTDETAYKEFCVALNIPDVYEDASDFMTSYFFDELNPDSVYSNLSRAYDDGILLRNTISTRSLAYIQLALDAMEDAKAEGPELCVL